MDDPAVTRCEIGMPKWDSCENGGFLDPAQNCEKCRCPRGYAGENCTDLEESGEKILPSYEFRFSLESSRYNNNDTKSIFGNWNLYMRTRFKK